MKELGSMYDKYTSSSDGTSGRKINITDNIFIQILTCQRAAAFVGYTKESLSVFENTLLTLEGLTYFFVDKNYLDKKAELDKDRNKVHAQEYERANAHTKMIYQSERTYLFKWFNLLLQLIGRRGMSTLGRQEVDTVKIKKKDEKRDTSKTDNTMSIQPISSKHTNRNKTIH